MLLLLLLLLLLLVPLLLLLLLLLPLLLLLLPMLCSASCMLSVQVVDNILARLIRPLAADVFLFIDPAGRALPHTVSSPNTHSGCASLHLGRCCSRTGLTLGRGEGATILAGAPSCGPASALLSLLLAVARKPAGRGAAEAGEKRGARRDFLPARGVSFHVDMGVKCPWLRTQEDPDSQFGPEVLGFEEWVTALSPVAHRSDPSAHIHSRTESPLHCYRLAAASRSSGADVSPSPAVSSHVPPPHLPPPC